MNSTNLKLSEIMSSRLCHDLITPIGAINTGLELLAEIGENSPDKDDILALITQSAKTASTRLSFYRVAFGSSGQQLTVDEAWAQIQRLSETSKIELSLENPTHINTPGLGRLLATLFLWIQECLPRGGTLSCTISPMGEISFQAQGTPLIVQQTAKEALLGGTPLAELSPRGVPGALAHILMGKMHKTITLETPEPHTLTLVIK